MILRDEFACCKEGGLIDQSARPLWFVEVLQQQRALLPPERAESWAAHRPARCTCGWWWSHSDGCLRQALFVQGSPIGAMQTLLGLVRKRALLRLQTEPRLVSLRYLNDEQKTATAMLSRANKDQHILLLRRASTNTDDIRSLLAECDLKVRQCYANQPNSPCSDDGLCWPASARPTLDSLSRRAGAVACCNVLWLPWKRYSGLPCEALQRSDVQKQATEFQSIPPHAARV